MITINLEKAQEIAHQKRRIRRDELFKPHDDVIAKQIPGSDTDTAEAARASIRTQDNAVQTSINTATDEVELKTILDDYGA